jgi:hypothetical protein
MRDRVSVRRTGWHRGTVAGVVAVALGLGGATVAASTSRTPAGVHTPNRKVDPRLVMVSRTTAVQARLSSDARLTGTLSPTIPGSNTLHLVIRDKAGAIVRGGHLRLSTTMPGMRMVPIITTLVPQSDGYSGVLLLPMFGRYRATVRTDTPTGRYAGTLAIVLLPPTFTTVR